jgi:hypothetical protein
MPVSDGLGQEVKPRPGTTRDAAGAPSKQRVGASVPCQLLSVCDVATETVVAARSSVAAIGRDNGRGVLSARGAVARFPEKRMIHGRHSGRLDDAALG